MLKILMLEDDAQDCELVAHELRRAGLSFELTRVETEAGFVSAVDPLPDIVIADYSVPGFDGTRALSIVREAGMEVPVIFVSGSIGEERAAELIKLGADDYLVKDRLYRLPMAVRSALERRDLARSQREADDTSRRATEALRESHARRRELLAGIVRAQEDERERLRAELSSGPVQAMTEAVLRVRMARAASAVEDVSAALEEVEEAVRAASALLARASAELAPPPPAPGAVISALRNLLDRDGDLYDATLKASCSPETVGAGNGLTFYRVAQEALANVRDHAGRCDVTLDFRPLDDGVLMTVSDNGAGFDAERVPGPPAHIGLSSMHERAELGGGWCRIESAPNSGTSIKVWLPAREG